MPPRYTYWTIILDGQPTAFRAADRETLLPTLKQLQSKNPGATLRWFAHGKVWDSPEQARASRSPRPQAGPRAEAPPQAGDRRDREWRPGGQHRDPRQKFKKETFQARRRREKKAAATAGGGYRPPSTQPNPPVATRFPADPRRGQRPDRPGPGGEKRRPEGNWRGPGANPRGPGANPHGPGANPRGAGSNPRGPAGNPRGPGSKPRGDVHGKPAWNAGPRKRDRDFRKPRPDRAVGREERSPGKWPDRHPPIVTDPTKPPEPQRRPLPQEDPQPSRPAPPERIRIESEPPEQGTPPGDGAPGVAPPHKTKMPRLRRSR